MACSRNDCFVQTQQRVPFVLLLNLISYQQYKTIECCNGNCTIVETQNVPHCCPLYELSQAVM